MKTENTLFSMFLDTYEKHRDNTAFVYKVDGQQFEVSYEKLFEDVLILSRAFKSKGVKKGSKVMFLCDNRYGWIVSDLAMVSLGVISIPRGSDTPTQELEFIISHAQADFLILESETLYDIHQEMLKTLKLKGIFVIEAEKIHTLFTAVYSYQDLLRNREIYENEITAFYALREQLGHEDTFTIIYTSGTTAYF